MESKLRLEPKSKRSSIITEDILIETAKALCEKFVNKVEAGRAQSHETYADCKVLLNMMDEFYMGK